MLNLMLGFAAGVLLTVVVFAIAGKIYVRQQRAKLDQAVKELTDSMGNLPGMADLLKAARDG